MAQLDNLGAKFDIKVAKSATLSLVFKWHDPNDNPYNLTGYTAKMEIRNKPLGNVLHHQASTQNGQITLDNTNGFIIEIPANDTEGFDFKRAFYDLEAYSPSGRVYRIIQGKIFMDKEVTI